MHNSFKKVKVLAKIAIIFLFSLFLVAGQEPVTKVSAWEEPSQADKTLEQKLEGKEKVKKNKKVEDEIPSTTDGLTHRELEIKKLARELELQERLKKEIEGRRKKETPSERKARKIIERQEKRAKKAMEFRQEMESLAGISGCPAGSVEITNQAEQYTRWGVGVAVDVTNTSAYPVSISRPRYGDIVRNLCPGGRRTLYFKFAHNEGNNVNFPLTATAITPDGVVWVDTTHIYLSRFSAPHKTMDEINWRINLVRQNQNR